MYAFSGRVKIVILRSRVCRRQPAGGRATKDLYVQLAEKCSSATTGIEVFRPAWNGGLRMTVAAL